MNKVYLGDGVYAHHDGYQIWLTTSDGFEALNQIALDTRVFNALLEYARSIQPKQDAE